MPILKTEEISKRLLEIEEALQTPNTSKTPVDQTHPTGGYVPDYIFDDIAFITSSLQQERSMLQQIMEYHCKLYSAEQRIEEINAGPKPLRLMDVQAIDTLNNRKIGFITAINSIEHELPQVNPDYANKFDGRSALNC